MQKQTQSPSGCPAIFISLSHTTLYLKEPLFLHPQFSQYHCIRHTHFNTLLPQEHSGTIPHRLEGETPDATPEVQGLNKWKRVWFWGILSQVQIAHKYI
jgi:hypothetical protein